MFGGYYSLNTGAFSGFLFCLLFSGLNVLLCDQLIERFVIKSGGICSLCLPL